MDAKTTVEVNLKQTTVNLSLVNDIELSRIPLLQNINAEENDDKQSDEIERSPLDDDLDRSDEAKVEDSVENPEIRFLEGSTFPRVTGYLNESLHDATIDDKITSLYQAIKTKNDLGFLEQLQKFPLDAYDIGWLIYNDRGKTNTLLQAVCKYGMLESAKYLISLGVNARFTTLENHQPIQLSCLFAQPRILEFLLQNNDDHSNEVKTKNERNLLHLSVKKSTGFNNSHECLKILLENHDQLENINEQDIHGRTPLHYAAINNNDLCVVELLLHGAHYEIKDDYNQSPLDYISKSAFKEYLDSLVTETKVRQTADGATKIIRKLNFNLSHFIRTPKHEDGVKLKPSLENYFLPTDLIYQISQNKNLQELIQHPILSLIIHYKYSSIDIFQYCHYGFYFWFCLLYTIYAVLTECEPVKSDHQNATDQNDQNSTDQNDQNSTVNSTVALENEKCFVDTAHPYLIFFICLFSVLPIALLFIRTFMINHYVTKYKNSKGFKKITSMLYLIAVLIKRLIPYLFPLFVIIWQESGNRDFLPQLKVCSILITYLTLFIAFVNFPFLKSFLNVFQKASLSLFFYITVHLALLIGFAISFYFLFHTAIQTTENHFKTVGMSIFRTLIMLTGEFDAQSIPFHEHAVLGRIIFVAFIFIVIFVLVNLLSTLLTTEGEVKHNTYLSQSLAEIDLIRDHYGDTTIGNENLVKSWETKNNAGRRNNPNDFDYDNFILIWDGQQEKFNKHLNFGILNGDSFRITYKADAEFATLHYEIITEAWRIVAKRINKN